MRRNARGRILTASQLRADVYRILDEVLETGSPVSIERKGQKLQIVPVRSGSKLDRLVPHPGTIVGDPEDLVHVDWTGEWRGRDLP